MVERGLNEEQRQRIADYLAAPAFQEMRCMQDAGADVSFSERLGASPFDAGAMSHVALSMAVETSDGSGVAELSLDDVSLVLEDADGGEAVLDAAEAHVPRDDVTYRPVTLLFDLGRADGLDKSRLSRITLQVRGGQEARVLCLDDIRFVRL